MTNTDFSTDPTFLTDETLHETYELEINDRYGNPVRFGELVAGKGDSVTTIVIFGEFNHPGVQGISDKEGSNT